MSSLPEAEPPSETESMAELQTGCCQKGCSVLMSMLSFPALVSIMWAASPNDFHWHHTFWSIVVGVVSWLATAILGMTHQMEPWTAVALTLEAGFGLVPVVYMLADFGRVGVDCFERVHQSRCLASVPVVLMAKQLGRTGVHLSTETSLSTWWHIYVDSAEILLYAMIGLWNATGLGEIWFVIYCAAPVVFASAWLDHLVVRVQTLLRANARLMRTAFVAVARIDGLDAGRVLESSFGFNELVDGHAEGINLGQFFTADAKHIEQLCLPSLDSERVVRRLRTTLVSLSKSFQQDVELRVLSVTEHELQKENGILLGVAIMGERLPYTPVDGPGTSVLLEQHLDEIGQLRVAGGTSSCGVPELVEVTSFDSISLSGMKQRRRKTASNGSSSVSSRTLSLTSSTKSTCRKKSVVRSEAAIYPEPWKESSGSAYMKECSLSNLEDLILSWNYKHSSCCHWHASFTRLSELVVEMRSWHTCSDKWPVDSPAWQCGACAALQHSDDNDACLLCFTPRADDSNTP